MNAEPQLHKLVPAPEPPVRPWISRLGDVLLGRVATIVMVALALAVGIATFVTLARGTPYGVAPGAGVALVLANLSVLLLLGAVLAGRITRVWAERRRGSAGSRLHVRLVLLYAGVAVAPSIAVAGFAVAFFHFGIQAWFNDPVRTAVTELLQVSRGYLEEHRNNIRAVALEMANDLTRAGAALAGDPNSFAEVLATQTTLRGLTEAVIYEPVTGQVLASAGLLGGLGVEPPPAWANEQARTGEVVGPEFRGRHKSACRRATQFDPAAAARDWASGRSGNPELHAPH